MAETIESLKAENETLREKLEEVQGAFDEYQEDSGALEKELESELEQQEAKIKQLEQQSHAQKQDIEYWKGKYNGSKKESYQAIEKLQSEMNRLEENYNLFKRKTTELEMSNDDLERQERMTSSSLADIEKKYHVVLERNALLEASLAERDEEMAILQHLKDELRDTQEELDHLRKKFTEQPPTLPDAMDTTTMPSTPHRPPETRAMSLDATPCQPTRGTWHETGTTVASALPSHLRPGHAGTGMPMSPNSPLLLVRDMLGRVKNLERRLQKVRQQGADTMAHMTDTSSEAVASAHPNDEVDVMASGDVDMASVTVNLAETFQHLHTERQA